MKIRTAIHIGLLALLAACGKSEPDSKAVAIEDQSLPETSPSVLTRTASVDGARLFFITPSDGDTVANPVQIEFGISDMQIVKAGDQQPDSGHHHLLINTNPPAFDLPIPADDQHIHFGDGSSTTEITLAPGKHELQMLLGDYLHIPHDPPLLSEKITITVE